MEPHFLYFWILVNYVLGGWHCRLSQNDSEEHRVTQASVYRCIDRGTLLTCPSVPKTLLPAGTSNVYS